MKGLRSASYRSCRWLIGKIIRPKVVGNHPAVIRQASDHLLYALEYRSLSDLIVLDLVTQQQDLPSPLLPVRIGDQTEDRRFFFLRRASHGWFRRNTMTKYSARMVRILEGAKPESPESVIPVGIFWSRAPQRDRSLVKSFFSENWAVTSRMRRLLNLFVNRHDIVVHIGTPVALKDLSQTTSARLTRRAARLLRVQFRNQRLTTMGPDFSHRRTLVDGIVRSRAVRDAIERLEPTARQQARLEKRARKIAIGIASNMAHPTIRVLESLLGWFWNRIYRGIYVHHLSQVAQIAETHTLVYLPSHRSHLDYLLLSYLLYENGLMIPHVAAGDNLNLPVLGAILRRGGAFFIRRSFRDDPLYGAVLSEYLHEAYRSGHCVEFFPEGGRTRTGRLLPARLGLLNMTLASTQRGLPRPLALIPVYFGYEKLVEAGSYLDELRGSEKQRETLGDVVSSVKLIRQNFGKVTVNFGVPLRLDEWLENRDAVDNGDAVDNRKTVVQLGREILNRINDAAAINPVNVTALVILNTPRLAMDERLLALQLDCCLHLLRADADHHRYIITDLPGEEIIRYVEELGLLNRESQPFGDVMSLTPFNAVLMTWYRNNVLHALAVPSLLACLINNRRRPVSRRALERMTSIVLPYIAGELSSEESGDVCGRWLAHLQTEGLLEASGDGYRPPRTNNRAHYRLHHVAGLISQTLQRLYIVIQLLHQHQDDGIKREDLEEKSQQVARKMARLYGINAPEFFDTRLFNRFIDQLLDTQAVSVLDDDTLEESPMIVEVLRTADFVLDAEFRYALKQEA